MFYADWLLSHGGKVQKFQDGLQVLLLQTPFKKGNMKEHGYTYMLMYLRYMKGSEFPLILMRTDSKNRLPAEIMTLWASTKLSSSQARVTSQNTWLSRVLGRNEDMNV